ncbi:hypothetical protein [Mangrovimonas sp. YM274]|uniref:hypothetical protein n=1 Tax=Mangrovimonas sp. YM274 TaxID=3070660 RepID=UPI0027DE2C65|nr:hypothetical protein [Mangrovimonas sp. YM274]WMI67429.1 hypothetical protein RBH95_09755 [Mangrovimonas sp. YM274]
MRKLLYLLFIGLCITSCDDGDVLDVELDFDDELTLCSESSDAYLLYKTKEAPYESLSLLFPSNSTNDNIFNPEEGVVEGTLTINGSSVRFHYRTYDNNPENFICNLIPDETVTVTNNYEATSGTVEYYSTFVDDDNDGVPTSVEDKNEDGDNDPSTNPTDTDGDGIPDYLDEDDDNDNVKTINEAPDPNGDGSVDDARDTDEDLTPDYLDEDDDQDGVLTRYEDEDGNKNPADDFAVDSVIPRYLDNNAQDIFLLDEFIENTFTRTISVHFTIHNIDITVLSTDELDLGTYELEVEYSTEE